MVLQVSIYFRLGRHFGVRSAALNQRAVSLSLDILCCPVWFSFQRKILVFFTQGCILL